MVRAVRQYVGQPAWAGYDGVNSLMETTHSDPRGEDEVVIAYFEKYRSSAGERAAYLRVSGIRAEVRQVCQQCQGATSTFLGRILYQVTCPSDACAKAAGFLVEFDYLSRNDNERIMEALRQDRGADPVWWLGFPIDFHAWKAALSCELSVDARVEAICAWLVGGEVWDRYRGMMTGRYEHGTGASGYFTPDFSKLTSEYPWTQNGICKVNILLDAMADQKQAKQYRKRLPNG